MGKPPSRLAGVGWVTLDQLAGDGVRLVRLRRGPVRLPGPAAHRYVSYFDLKRVTSCPAGEDISVAAAPIWVASSVLPVNETPG